MELKDKLEKELREYYYEIEDLCSNIKINVNNDEIKLRENDKNMVLIDINNICNWLSSKHYTNIKKDKYLDSLKMLKKKYSTLILRMSKNQSKITGANTHKLNVTSIYNDDDDDDNIYDIIENNELGIDDDTDKELATKLRELRKELMNICYATYNVLSDESFDIDDKYKFDLKDYIDDILLWVHVEEKISKNEYKQKIDEINDACNKILSKNPILFNKDNTSHTTRQDLEHLCYAIKCNTVYNPYSLHEKQLNKLNKKVDNILEWLIDMDIKSKKAEINNEKYEISNDMYEQKMEEINNICNAMYNDMVFDKNAKTFPIIINNDNQVDNIINTNGTAVKDL